MKKFRTVASVIIMVIAGIVGFFVGASVNEAMTGAVFVLDDFRNCVHYLHN